jgi:hypothetical protein
VKKMAIAKSLFRLSLITLSKQYLIGKLVARYLVVLEKLAERYETTRDYLLGFTDDPHSIRPTNETKKPKDLQNP